MNIILSGKKCVNTSNLKGKIYCYTNNIPLEISNAKIELFNMFLFPLFSKNWIKLHENSFFIDKYKNKMEEWYKIYHMEDLIFYLNLLKSIEVILEEHDQLTELENKMYGNNPDKNTKQIYSMIYKTTMIKLKPEYEVYDSIFGKPNRKNNEMYNEIIISRIKLLLNEENMTYDKLKSIIKGQ